ncbi:MAG TPA: class II aldolase/adducin family protein [Beijerinckiaceae bacterium]|nr:class II aldolase/adducin family protein [Beijerinckiaceae bacterium]
MPGHTHAVDPAAYASEISETVRGGPKPSQELCSDLVVANHILFREGVLDAFGHVSARHDARSDRFLLAKNMAPGLVTADDLIEFNFDGAAVNANGRAVYLERFIHGEIYRARPDVHAIVHSHSASVVPFGIVRGVPFRAVCHMSGFIGVCAPIFEIREAAGDASDLLIRNSALGAALARALGDQTLVLMRGHGSTVVGNSLKQAVFRAVYTETNARLQAEAMRLGPITYLTEGEAATTAEVIDKQSERAWALWRMRAEGKL